MKLKTVEIDGKTYAEVQDGKPVYDDGGKDVAFDAAGTADTIKRLNAEAKGHREAKEAAEAALKKFDGIDDPAAALKAIETVGNLDKKKLIDAGEVEKVKADIRQSYEAKLAEAQKLADEAKSALNKELVGGSFARSKFIAEHVAVPADFIEAKFGQHFSVEGGKLVAKDATGEPIFSKAKPGEPAGFDEALSILIDGYSHKDSILKGTGGSGTGKQPGQGAPSGAKTITRSDFNGMDHAARAAKVRDGYTVVDA